MVHYMLDTNVVSQLYEDISLDRRISSLPIGSISISSITEAELRYGVAKKPGSLKLQRAVEALLAWLTVVPFDGWAAQTYGTLRTKYESEGLSVGALDGLIAAHALASESILVTRDLALMRLAHWVAVERW